MVGVAAELDVEVGVGVEVDRSGLLVLLQANRKNSTANKVRAAKVCIFTTYPLLLSYAF